MYLLGYMARENRLYLIDKEFQVVRMVEIFLIFTKTITEWRGDILELAQVSYELLLSILEYKTCIVRRDLATAATVRMDISKYLTPLSNLILFPGSQVLPSIPVEHHNKVARFLEAQGFKEEALEIATDPDYKFELAVQVTLTCMSKFFIATVTDWHLI
jgi:coatomer subunit beta'